MDSRYTPTYINLWNRDFFLLIIAELLLCVACYMSIPFLPQITTKCAPFGINNTYAFIIVFVIGMYASGSFNSWLIQHFRRNKVFISSAAGLVLLQIGFITLEEEIKHLPKELFTISLSMILLTAGAAFGTAKRTLSCTLLIDKTESQHRTEANYAAVATARMAVAIGPALFFLLNNCLPTPWYHSIAIIFTIVSIMLVGVLKFPFRAPEEDTKFISTDRFFLTQGWKVFIEICCIAIAFGFILSHQTNATFYLFLLFGFLCSIILLCNRKARENKYTFIMGVTVFILASTALAAMPQIMPVVYISASMTGIGLGTACSCQLFHMLDLCRHCQRSTAESTYFLACDGGILLGIFLSYIPAVQQNTTAIAIVTLCCITAIVCHEWENKRNFKTK